MARQGLANTFGLPMEKVRVQAAPIGGAFGGKLMISEPLAAAAALKLRRPVRIVFSRREDFAAGNPAPGQLIELELGATADGALTAIRGRIMGDRGGLGDMGVEAISTMLSAGPYRWPAHDLTALGVSTNRVSPGAYRAPGAPPAAFAVETLMDELAQQLGRDPIDLRLQNVLVAGDKGIDGQEIEVFGARECLERVREHPLYANRDQLPDDEGVGVALGFWPGGLEPAGAICKLDSDGRLTIVTAAADMSGIENAFIAIAAEAFGLPEESVRVTTGDTASAPYGGVAGGSKVTYTYGRAVERAAEEAKQRLLDAAASELEIAPEDLEVADGEVRPVGAPARAISIADLAAKTYTFGGRHRPIEGYGSSAQISRAPGAAVHLSHVKVDRDTGEVRLLAHVIAQDVGKALNPALVEGPDARRHGPGHGLGAAGGAVAQRGRPAPGRDVRRVRAAEHGPGPADRDAADRGARTRRPVRGQGRRRAAGLRRSGRDRERHRGRYRNPAERVADDSGAGMGATPERPPLFRGPVKARLLICFALLLRRAPAHRRPGR